MATQQEVMKAFMKSLDETENSGRAALDEAVKNSSKFTSYQAVLEKFQSDWKSAGNWHTFLVKYCGIILDNKDTGSILGKDAGGATSKGEDDIIPCKGDASYPSGTSFTVNGLTIYGVPDKDDLTDDEQFIVQGLYSWWLRDSLNLIEESYGLSYSEENTTNSRMKLQLFEEDSGNLAYVLPGGYDGKEFESRVLGVNMANFQNMPSDNRQGKIKIEGTELYLTRTIVHELTHGVMASNVNYFMSLPLPIIEGATAELIHGIDDKRRKDIINYAKNTDSAFDKLVDYLAPELGGVEMDGIQYAGGYIFMRYFLKQASDTTFDYDTYSENVTVDDENFAVNYFDKITMTGSNLADTITNSGENVTINALDGENLIRNYSDNVKITSGAGIDTIYNENSHVEIISGSGNDSITSSGENSMIDSGAGNDNIESSGKNSAINGGAGDDIITSEGENSTVNSGAGNDSIYGGNSNVKINVGAGNDFIYFLGFGDSIPSNNTIYGGKGNDTININFTSIIFYGEAGNDSIQSAGANSSLKGGAGVDSIKNTGENAIIWGDAGNDLIINGSEGSSSVFGSSTSDENSDLSSIGANSTVYGGAGKDSIQNIAKNIFIYGGAGKDSIENGGASSFLYGDAGNDYFSNESDFVSIHGGAGKDIIENSGESSALYGNAGNDYITNISDSVSIFGGKGKDSIENRGDSVLIEGGAGKDSIYNSGAKVSIDFGAGNDYIYNEGAVISINGGKGNDKIYNFGDHITISGGAGKDYIENSGGKHITYEFGKNSGKDTVVGFNADDTIKITRGGYSAVASGDDVIVSVGKSFMTLKDATGIAINFITAADKTETWSGDNNLSSIVKDNLSSIAYDKIGMLNNETLVQDNIPLAYSDK